MGVATEVVLCLIMGGVWLWAVYTVMRWADKQDRKDW